MADVREAEDIITTPATAGKAGKRLVASSIKYLQKIAMFTLSAVM